MLIGLGRLWSWWNESWRSARRARLQYAAMAIAFAVLAIIAAVLGEPVVAAVAGVVSVVTVGLAVIAPRLSAWAKSSETRSSDGR
jgi:hypothetical protein